MITFCKGIPAKAKELYCEMRQDFTMPSRGVLIKAIFLLLALMALALVIVSIANHYFPEEKLQQYSKYGYPGVFLVMLIASLTIFLPLPGTTVAIAAAQVWNPALVALVASLGSTLGEISGYLLGYGGKKFTKPERHKTYQLAEKWMKRRGGFTIFLFALIPSPVFDFVGIIAGIFHYPLKRFMLFTWLGRFPRSLIECYVGSLLLDFIFEHLPFSG